MTYSVQRDSSHRKFRSLSFFEKSNMSYPSLPLSKQSKGSSFKAHGDVEMHFPRAFNHELFPFVDVKG